MNLKSIFFRDTKQLHLFFILVCSSVFSITMVCYRIQYTQFSFAEINSVRELANFRGHTTFLFLVWNLFLAWIPYGLSLSLRPLQRYFPSKILLAMTLSCWLLFLPNAPYIITDLLHLTNRFPVPHWYDLMMLFSFAWTGLMLGLLSMYEVQLFLAKKLRPWLSTLLVWLTIPATSFGIWLGRFHRWNSWDIINAPKALFHDIINQVINPSHNWRTLSITVIMTVLLSLVYFTLTTLIQKENKVV